jgi:hypothetical protein
MKRASDFRSEVIGCDDARRAIVQSVVRCLRKPVSDPRALAALLRGDARPWPRSLARAAAEHAELLHLVTRSGYADIAEAEVEGICSALGLDEGRLENVDVIERQLEI